MKLSKRIIDTVINSKRSKTLKLFDGGGMYLQIPLVGNPRWRLKYRFGGREKLISLGIYTIVSLSHARKKRRAAKLLLDQGIDPSTAKKEMMKNKKGI